MTLRILLVPVFTLRKPSKLLKDLMYLNEGLVYQFGLVV